MCPSGRHKAARKDEHICQCSSDGKRISTRVQVPPLAPIIPDDLRAVLFHAMKRGDTVPHRLARPCRAYLCPNVTTNTNGYCYEHQALAREHRGSARQRGYTYAWEQFRARYLREHPLCVDCLAEHRMTPATEVHHIHKLRDYPQLKYSENNLMALCHQCHSKRTARGE